MARCRWLPTFAALMILAVLVTSLDQLGGEGPGPAEAAVQQATRTPRPTRTPRVNDERAVQADALTIQAGGACFGAAASGPGPVGGPGNDVFIGTAAGNSLSGGGGNDRLCGEGGDDSLSGGFGDDRLDGGPGNDQLDGGPGNDTILGGPGTDQVRGEDGADEIDVAGDPGARDQVACGAGVDKVRADPDDVLAGCEQATIVGPDAAPSVTGTTPTNGATGVALNATIGVTFSESVTVTSSSFTLECPSGTSTGFTLSGTAPTTGYTLTPTASLPASTTCRVTVLANQISDADADDPPNGLAANYVFSFATDAAPAVTTTSPADAATGVAVDATITVSFNEAVNATTGSFEIRCPSTSATATHTFTLGSAPATSFTLDPSTDLPGGTTCQVTVLAGQITDADTADPPDQMAANVSFAFTTTELSAADLSIGMVTVTCYNQTDPQDIPECDTNGDSNPVFSVRFIITVTNPASFAVPNVVVTDKLNGTALRYFQDDSATTVTSYDQITGQWTIPSIPANGSVTLRLDANAWFCAAGVQTTTNAAAITSAGAPDLNPANNMASSGNLINNETC